jgi:hypothetical protein
MVSSASSRDLFTRSAYSTKTRIKTQLQRHQTPLHLLGTRSAYSTKTRIKTYFMFSIARCKDLAAHIPLKQGLRLLKELLKVGGYTAVTPRAYSTKTRIKTRIKISLSVFEAVVLSKCLVS